jgi:hypothetical protein
MGKQIGIELAERLPFPLLQDLQFMQNGTIDIDSRTYDTLMPICLASDAKYCSLTG